MQVVSELSQAFALCSATDEATAITIIRQVDPLFLYLVEPFDATYLDAYCRLRQEFRTFHLDRIPYPSD